MTKNHSFRHTLFFVWMSACSLLTASCGLIDMELDEDVQMVYDMRLDRDTVYVTEGDSFVLHPVFVPDTVSNREVFFLSANEEVAYLTNDTIVAVSEGETVISAISVKLLSASRDPKPLRKKAQVPAENSPCELIRCKFTSEVNYQERQIRREEAPW